MHEERLKTNPKAATARARWLVVGAFAVAMAWVESAVVVYLRTITGQTNPVQPTVLPPLPLIEVTEVIRELATLVMLATVGWLAGRHFRTRFGYALIAFGVWDLFYYVFLKPLTGWPNSLLDWDILFLIPLPWWGPVLAPCLIAALMILFGTLVTQFRDEHAAPWPGWPSRIACALGVILALYVFMADAIRVAPQGVDALREMLPTRFNWPLFGVALLFMAAPVVETWRQLRPRPAKPPVTTPSTEESA
jgi:hypothetical protein